MRCRLAILVASALLLAGARKPLPPSGDLLLDANDPVIAVEVQKVPMRLHVDLDRQDSVELNPAAAARLPVKWGAGGPVDVGRTRLASHVAGVLLEVDGRTLPVEVAHHGRDCCDGVDGVIGPDLLPFATVRWRNRHAPVPSAERTLPLNANPNLGLSTPAGVGTVQLHFSLERPETVGTAAAGAALARLWAGRWDGPEHRVPIAFGISRPARLMAFAHPAPLAGFPLDRLLVRVSDFAGDARLPEDPRRADEITVAHRLARQDPWPAVTIGIDRLSSCAEIIYAAVPRSLTLRCAFDTR